MKYYVSDIVRRAKQIADLENSDFISWNENIHLVNEAWTTLYQKMINKNDKSFVKEIDISKGVNELPEDFYQISSVISSKGQLVQKHTAGMSESDTSYQIKGYDIILRGTSSATLSYFPTPVFLTYRNDVIELSNVSGLPIMGNGHFLLTNTGVYNLDKDEAKETFAADMTAHYIDASGNRKEGYGVKFPDGTTKNFKDTFPDIYNTVSSSLNFMSQISFIDDYLYIVRPSQKMRVFNVEDGKELSTEEISDINENFTGFMFSAPTISNGHLFYATDKFVYIDDNAIYDASQIGMFAYLLKVDLDTGYGFFSGNSGGKVYPITLDTYLNFPNNIYFTLIAYQLAYNYCCKQSKDVSLVSSQLALAWEVYYDTLANDGWQQEKIVNMYRYRG